MQYLNGLGETTLMYNLLLIGKQKICDYSGLTQSIQISLKRGTKQIETWGDTLLTASFSLHSYISHEEGPLKCPLKNPLLYLSRLIPPRVPGGDRLGGPSYGAGEQRANPSAAPRLKEICLLSLTHHTNVLCGSEDVKHKNSVWGRVLLLCLHPHARIVGCGKSPLARDLCVGRWRIKFAWGFWLLR